MIYYGLALHSLDSYFQFKEVTAPGTPQANELRVYAKDKSGTSALYLKDDAGSEREIGAANTVTGTGTANRLAYWSSSSVLAANAALTSTRIPFSDTNGLPVDSSSLTFDNTNFALTVKSNASVTRGFISEHYQTGGQGPTLVGRRANGTIASPSATLSGDVLLDINAQGWVSSAFTTGRGLIRMLAAENFTGSAQGSEIGLFTTPIGSTTIAERFRIGPSGQLGIGGATYGTAGYIFKSGGASAAPTWTAPADVTAGSTKITLGGTPTGASLVAFSIDVNQANLDHGSIGGLSDDDHTGYAFLAGRSGGQSLIGGTGSGDDITLQSTSNATRGDIITDCADITMVAGSRLRMASQNRFRFLNSMARLTKSAAQTITTTSPTVVTWDGTSFDTDSLFVDVDDTVTVQIAGKYLIVANIRWAANTTGFRVTSIESNASGSFVEEAASVYAQNTGSGDAGGQALAILNLAAGDKIRLIGYHTVGSDLDIVQTSLGGTSLTVAYIGE